MMTRMHRFPTLETARLWLRPLELTDAAQAQPLFAQWEVVRYLNDKVPWPFPADGVSAYYSAVALPAIERGDEWHWTLRLKTDPEKLIGSIGLMKSAALNRGFWLAIPWHGQGLMSEATEAVNDFWFGELDFSRMRVQKAGRQSWFQSYLGQERHARRGRDRSRLRERPAADRDLGDDGCGVAGA